MRVTVGFSVPLVTAFAAVLLSAPPSEAVHLYRGPDSGCTPADGPLTDDPAPSGPVGASIIVLHNTFNDEATGLPVSVVSAGQAVEWKWYSSHCHSVDGRPGFYSGFHYPAAEPESPPLLPGVFHYPVPDQTPTMTFTHTFTTPGTYVYTCEHHALIGMIGIVIVQ